MSVKLSRSDALEDISGWDTESVLCLLRKNGLAECCKAMAKRQIDGDELLHLTDGKLALWKSDLTRPLRGQLWAFVQELKRSPENYLPDRRDANHHHHQSNDDHLSDSGSWDTDFDDEENCHLDEGKGCAKMTPIADNRTSARNHKIVNRTPIRQPKEATTRPETEETYANCECLQDEENTYANFQEAKRPPPSRNVSRLYSQTLAEKLKEELERRKDQPARKSTEKPAVGPKPETLPSRRIQAIADEKLPLKSFLHNVPRTSLCDPKETHRRMGVPPPPEPGRRKNRASVVERADNELPKPPATLRNFDLVANLPARTEDSEDEYETVDENIIGGGNQKVQISRADSKHSLQNGREGSVESIYKPPSSTSHEEEEEEREDGEIYESITETPEDNGYYLSPIQRAGTAQDPPPPLPAKPSPATPLPSTVANRNRPGKVTERLSAETRSVSTTFSGCSSPVTSSTSLPVSVSTPQLGAGPSDRATRPLPPPPARPSYEDKPWFHNCSRDQATFVIREQTVCGYRRDGFFLVRPSSMNSSNPLTLVLWYKDKVYNIAVRKRNDNRWALGTEKANELSFPTVEDIVTYYKREELVLYSGGVQAGSTMLLDSPPKT